MWTYVWFGRKMHDFSSFKNAMVTVSSMTVGEFSAFAKMKDHIGWTSFLFYIPYQLFMIIIIVNFPRAVLNAGYADAAIKHQEIQAHGREVSKASTTESTGKLAHFKAYLKRLVPADMNAKAIRKLQKGGPDAGASKHKKSACFIYFIFTSLYCLMCILIMQTRNASFMTEMVYDVFEGPTLFKSQSDYRGCRVGCKL